MLVAMLMGLAALSFAASGGASAPARVDFAAADAVIAQAIAEHQIPGAVLVVGHNGRVVYRKAYGQRALTPVPAPMAVDTVFDLASLTKVVATTTAVMQLFEQGKFRLNDPVAKYLPEFAQNEKDDVTIRQLLIHYSGLREDLDLTQPWQGRDAGFRLAFAEKLVRPPGAQFVYSDINFIVLGALVEKLSGMPLDEYCARNIFAPQGMKQTRFTPPAGWRGGTAPTENDESGHMLQGVVHDPTARRMGGVAGHAGLFSTAGDLAIFAQALLEGRARAGKLLSPATVQKMTTPQQPANAVAVRGLGWDIDSPFSSNRGELLPVGSFGHTGFTGTSLWIDPATKTYIVLLSNAIHTGQKGSAVALRTKVATAVGSALSRSGEAKAKSAADTARLGGITGYSETAVAGRRVTVRNGAVKTGLDVLQEHGFAELHADRQHPRRIGILTNQTGVDALGRRTVDVLAHAPGISLTAIFSPEHGATGALDTEKIGDSKDALTGVPIYSVYGASDAQRRPSQQVLRGLDAVVFDLQDAGVRFYTYETTLGYFLEACAQAGIELIVLDRPNPLNGASVQGLIADAETSSFVAYHPLPVRHGMTLGELARMFNTERKIGAKLTVVAMEGWQRGDWFDSTGVAWIPPSPNLRTLNEVILYPGVALVEAANVSVGRGTGTPFEVLGAPWINGRQLAAYLNARLIAGVRFVPTAFTPTASAYVGTPCEGVNLMVLDRETLDAGELGLELAAALHKLYPQQFELEKVNGLLANVAALEALRSGHDPRRMADDASEALAAFVEKRKAYLLYP